jgi:hypothetical protein
MTDKQKQLAWALAGAALIILLPLAAMAARGWGLIDDPDNDLSGRIYGIIGGLIVAAYGNIAPRKLLRYDPTSPRPAARQAALRFSGWAFVLGGLANAAIWAFVSPLDNAAMLSMIPLAAALILVLTRCARLRTRRA